jgi:hypothetical protein
MYADLIHPNLPPVVADDRSTPEGEAISCDEQWLESRSSTDYRRSRNERPTIRVKVPPHKEDGRNCKDHIDSIGVLL